MCKKRILLYETYCLTCHKKDLDEEKRKKIGTTAENRENSDEIYRIQPENDKKRKHGKNEKKVKGNNKENYRVKYIEETGRICYERKL